MLVRAGHLLPAVHVDLPQATLPTIAYELMIRRQFRHAIEIETGIRAD